MRDTSSQPDAGEEKIIVRPCFVLEARLVGLVGLVGREDVRRSDNLER